MTGEAGMTKPRDDNVVAAGVFPGTAARQELAPAAKRALAEAEVRRKAYEALEAAMPQETGGRGGREPVRYGDWEIRGLASDF